jgi:hypothetical protein
MRSLNHQHNIDAKEVIIPPPLVEEVQGGGACLWQFNRAYLLGETPPYRGVSSDGTESSRGRSGNHRRGAGRLNQSFLFSTGSVGKPARLNSDSGIGRLTLRLVTSKGIVRRLPSLVEVAKVHSTGNQ